MRLVKTDKDEEDTRRVITKDSQIQYQWGSCIKKENKNMQWRSNSAKTWKIK